MVACLEWSGSKMLYLFYFLTLSHFRFLCLEAVNSLLFSLARSLVFIPRYFQFCLNPSLHEIVTDTFACDL